MTWDYPAIVVAGFLLTLVVARWLVRIGSVSRGPGFECQLCGLRELASSAQRWRYCPNCGVPRESSRPGDMPRRRRSARDR